MNKENDILESEELKREPFSVPYGYFENFRKSMRPWEKGKTLPSTLGNDAFKNGLLHRITPYLALAAMFAAIAVLGLAVLKDTDTDIANEYSSLVYADMIPLTDPDSIYYIDESNDTGISEQDVVDYLIYSGISIENIR